jgi:hypothetical protein
MRFDSTIGVGTIFYISIPKKSMWTVTY